jgi:hypothetical protein
MISPVMLLLVPCFTAAETSFLLTALLIKINRETIGFFAALVHLYAFGGRREEDERNARKGKK